MGDKFNSIITVDPFVAYMMSIGWMKGTVTRRQNSIASKLTLDMFTGEPTPLNDSEVEFRVDVDNYYAARRRKEV